MKIQRIICLCFALIMSIVASTPVYAQKRSATLTPIYGSAGVKEFADVDPDRFGSVSIWNLTARGFIQGDEDGLFHPNNPITRAQFIKLLCDVMDSELDWNTEGDAPFADVKEWNWHYKYVKSAKENGLLTPYEKETRLYPERFVTRDAAIQMCHAALNLMGNVLTEEEKSSYFPEVEKFSRIESYGEFMHVDRSIYSRYPYAHVIREDLIYGILFSSGSEDKDILAPEKEIKKFEASSLLDRLMRKTDYDWAEMPVGIFMDASPYYLQPDGKTVHMHVYSNKECTFGYTYTYRNGFLEHAGGRTWGHYPAALEQYIVMENTATIGINQMDFTATDAYGNEIRMMLSFYLEPVPPQARITEPTEERVSAGNRVKIIAATKFCPDGDFFINGEKVDTRRSPYASSTEDYISEQELPAGRYEIEFVGRNLWGDEVRDSKTLIVED